MAMETNEADTFKQMNMSLPAVPGSSSTTATAEVLLQKIVAGMSAHGRLIPSTCRNNTEKVVAPRYRCCAQAVAVLAGPREGCNAPVQNAFPSSFWLCGADTRPCIRLLSGCLIAVS